MFHQQRCRGFTLIELLIAITAFTFIIAGGYAALNSLVRVWEQQQQQAEQLQELQVTWHQLQQDLQQMIARRVRDNSGGHLAAATGTSSSLQAVRSGWSNPLAQQRSELQRYRYQLDNGLLLRSWWINTDSSLINGDQQDVLLHGLQELQFRYLDSNRDWQSQWPPANPGQTGLNNSLLPLAVEVSLVFADDSRYRRAFATVGLN
ncbi:MAG: type II secretion system minor pseudopilin GspJ [Gammaproteobacteria bacterium]|jgi:general secretion pathway protein J|nr:type II secretion system minor pseudopilin GspJ [Gammaproteobacteria bacterium]